MILPSLKNPLRFQRKCILDYLQNIPNIFADISAGRRHRRKIYTNFWTYSHLTCALPRQIADTFAETPRLTTDRNTSGLPRASLIDKMSLTRVQSRSTWLKFRGLRPPAVSLSLSLRPLQPLSSLLFQAPRASGPREKALGSGNLAFQGRYSSAYTAR